MYIIERDQQTQTANVAGYRITRINGARVSIIQFLVERANVPSPYVVISVVDTAEEVLEILQRYLLLEAET